SILDVKDKRRARAPQFLDHGENIDRIYMDEHLTGENDVEKPVRIGQRHSRRYQPDAVIGEGSIVDIRFGGVHNLLAHVDAMKLKLRNTSKVPQMPPITTAKVEDADWRRTEKKPEQEGFLFSIMCLARASRLDLVEPGLSTVRLPPRLIGPKQFL